MSAPLWVVEAAAAFWRAAGAEEPFPRALEAAIAWAAPLSIVQLPRLRVAGVAAWLTARGGGELVTVPDRALRACLVAHRGHGFVFLDADDPPDEQRFSLAHELAHFLHDYQQPRERAVARLGPAVLEVLDGARPPTATERIDALLARVELGPHVHFMERTEDGHPAHHVISAAERAADQLAFELLAPEEAVRAAAMARGRPWTIDALAALLIAVFGLPPTPARQYAALLAPAPPPPDPLLRRLGLAPTEERR
ncbi:MAG TPA: ImmA/IrrE family metallo-endopeptidase [Chloroflexota bacterium]|jgi:hypothetical protein|nr:ImmA/IrrE family metallo-endopeptidase [Chloroflexota bacterium]